MKTENRRIPRDKPPKDFVMLREKTYQMIIGHLKVLHFEYWKFRMEGDHAMHCTVCQDLKLEEL